MTNEELYAAMMEQFSVVNGRLETVDGRLDRMDGRLDRMDGRLDRMDERFDQMDIRQDSFDSDITRLRLLYENDFLPRLEHIESIYLDTYKLFAAIS